MPRKRKGTIRETVAELRDLLKKHHRKPTEARVKMLIMMQEDPTCTIAHVAESLNYNERMIRRWWKDYDDGGLQKLLGENGNGITRGLVAEAREEPYMNGHAVPAMIPPNIERFFNALPVMDNVIVWIIGFRTALQDLLGDVDRVSLNIESKCDIHNPESNSRSEFFVMQHVHESEPGKRSSRVTTQLQKKLPGEMILDGMRRGGFPMYDYQSPHYFDYYLQGKAYLGTVILWRAKDNPPISKRTFDAMESLRHFLIFALSDCVARQNRERNNAQAFDDIVTEIARAKGLASRELEVLLYYILGKDIEEISKALYIGKEAVRKHIKAIHRKLEVRSYKELIARYFTPLRNQ